MSKRLITKFFLLIGVFSLIGVIAVDMANAQIAVSVDARETYDDNIFLENNRRRPNAFVLNDAIEDDIEDGNLSILGGEPADGKKDSDQITNLSVSASGSLENLSKSVKGGWNLGTGLLVFTDYSDYSRITVDGLLNLSLADGVIPKPFFATLSSGLSSQSTNVSVAQGSAARSAQTWVSTISTGIKDYEVASETFLGAGYRAGYNKFLGQWLLGSNSDDRFRQQGTDYISHTLFTTLDHQFTKSFNSGFSLDSGVSYFSSVDSNTAGNQINSNSLDRYSTNFSWVSTYQASSRLSLSSALGVNSTSFVDDPAPLELTIINEDGESENQVIQREDTQTGLIGSLEANYAFEPGSSFGLNLAQNRATNVDGSLITLRSVGASLNKAIGDRFLLNLASNYLTYSTDSSVSNGVNRFENSVTLNYALTQDTTLNIGYNYAVQDADDDNLEPALLFQSQDYNSNRFFIGISSGIIGKRS